MKDDFKISVSELKKVELHCHLMGIIGPSLIRDIKNSNYRLIDSIELSKIYPVTGIQGFNKWLNITLPYQTASIDIFLTILEVHINKLIRQNVIYTEIMISPTIFPKSLNKMVSSLEIFKKKVKEMEIGKIQVEFIMVIPRNLPEEKITNDVINFIELFKLNLIVGVALVGIENNQSLKRFYTHFKKLKDCGLGIEIHAGEHGNQKVVEETINYGLADRIGHGISAFKSQSLIKKIKKLNIHIEFCITSNLRTKSVKNIKSHPIQIARELELNYSINTDDPGIFECTMNDEYQLLIDQFGFTKNEFDKIFKNSISSSFIKKTPC